MATASPAAEPEVTRGTGGPAASVTLVDPYAEARVTIPPLGSLDDFLAWMLSDAAPERGRFTYLAGELECDLTGQSFFRHGDPVEEIARVIGNIVRKRDLGYVTTHETLIALPEADAGVEPDVVFVSHQTLDSDRIAFRDTKNRPIDKGPEANPYALVGPPDLVVEVVGNTTVRKDTVKLRAAYERAGVTEYWLVDAREDAVSFTLFRLVGRAYAAAKPDDDGFVRSDVLGRSFRLTRAETRTGRPRFVCEDRG